jgi:hypothetical protein
MEIFAPVSMLASAFAGGLGLLDLSCAHAVRLNNAKPAIAINENIFFMFF